MTRYTRFFLTLGFAILLSGATKLWAQDKVSKPEIQLPTPGLYILEDTIPKEENTEINEDGHKMFKKDLIKPLINRDSKVKYLIVSKDANGQNYKIAFLPCAKTDEQPGIVWGPSPQEWRRLYTYPEGQALHSLSHSCLSQELYLSNLSVKATKEKLTFEAEVKKIDEQVEVINPEYKPTPQEHAACAALAVCRYVKYKTQITFEHKISHFKLIKIQVYQDILNRNKILPVYLKQDINLKYKSYLQPWEPFAILETQPDWFKIERLSKDKIVAGWIAREHLVHGKWIEQKAMTDRFTFRVAISNDEQNPSFMSADALEIKDRRLNKRHQILFNLGAEGNFFTSPEAYLQLVDANFDGQLDIMIQSHDGGAGLNSGYYFYLFNPVSDQFEYHKGLSSLVQTTVDPATKTVSSAWRDGPAYQGSKHYQFINGIFTKIASWERRFLTDKEAEVTEGKLENGKWISTTKIVNCNDKDSSC